METNHHCPKCQCSNTVKNGQACGKPRRKCKECRYQFTLGAKKGFSLQTKLTALIIYMSGVSIRRTAYLVNASHVSVQRWIEMFGKSFGERPRPPIGKPKTKIGVTLEMDEMWHYLEKKLKNYGYGKPTIGSPGCWLIGNAAVAIFELSANSKKD